jgi:hypothetical protein
MKTSMIIHEMSGILLERDKENGLNMNRIEDSIGHLIGELWI